MEYEVLITKSNSITVNVEADSEEEAIKQIRDDYENRYADELSFSDDGDVDVEIAKNGDLWIFETTDYEGDGVIGKFYGTTQEAKKMLWHYIEEDIKEIDNAEPVDAFKDIKEGPYMWDKILFGDEEEVLWTEYSIRRIDKLEEFELEED